MVKLFALIDGPQTWRSDIKACEPLPEGQGRTRWRETNGWNDTITSEVVARRPPLFRETRIITPGLPFSGTWTQTLEVRGGVTLLRITEHGEVYNPVFRFVARFVIGHARTIEQYLRDLGTAVGERIEIAP